MKILAIDYGTKRIGIAVGDSKLRIAMPKGVIKNSQGAVDEVARVITDSGIEKVIVGLPLTPSGKEGQRALMVREFVDRLREKLPEVDIELWDERYTTMEAESRLSHIPPKKRKNLIDSVSAQIILEEYLRSK